MRTTNHLEGWHRKLNDAAGHAHPNILKIVSVFISEQKMTTIKIAQLDHGAPANRRRSKYVMLSERIQRLRLQLLANEVGRQEYAHAISHLMGF